MLVTAFHGTINHESGELFEMQIIRIRRCADNSGMNMWVVGRVFNVAGEDGFQKKHAEVVGQQIAAETVAVTAIGVGLEEVHGLVFDGGFVFLVDKFSTNDEALSLLMMGG